MSFETLFETSKKNSKYPCKSASLMPGTRWCVKYYCYDFSKNGLVRKRWYKGFSSHKTPKAKHARNCPVLYDDSPYYENRGR